MIQAYRIARKEFADTIWSGAGAREYGGRWNSKGVAVAYAAESRSLAALEQLVHLVKPRILNEFVLSSIAFAGARVLRLDPGALPADWSKPVAPASLKQFGDDWASAMRYPILAVPSAVILGEWNHLVNPSHREFAKMAKTRPEPFAFDYRLA